MEDVSRLEDGRFRIERDAMGEVAVPVERLWGAQTQRAVENFAISGQRFGRAFIKALGHVKLACARANVGLERLDPHLAAAIVQACDEVIEGEWDEHFPVDIFQTGSGTSTNMNANEVLSNRAIQLLGGVVGSKSPVHPNDHVNMSQSSNDVIPTAIHVAVTLALRDDLIPALEQLHVALLEKACVFDDVLKIGRTHLQDATPIRLGQEFSGYAAQIELSLARARRAVVALRELPLGGTAVGTGINCPPDFPLRAIEHLNMDLNADFVEARNHVEANAARDALVEASGLVKTVAVSLHKIANDVRWLGSGPRNGLGELRLPAVQPGSSIMPGKINPVIPEAVLMVCTQVIACDVAITQGGLGGHFELNLMMPLIAHNLLEGITWMANVTRVFTERCIAGLEADRERCRESIARTLSLATALAPVTGYDRAAEIAKEAYRTNRTVRDVALAWGVLPQSELDDLLDARRMTESEAFEPD